MEQRAPLWRPILTAALFFGIWAVRQSPERLQQRSWTTYTILAGILAGCAVVAWGIQHARGIRWDWFVELGIMIGLLFAAGLGLGAFLPLILGE
jgi:type IV secretory pathway VirB2 component (pilin)